MAVRVPVAVLAAGVVLLAACGSTAVQDAGRPPTGDGVGVGGGVGGATFAPADPGAQDDPLAGPATGSADDGPAAGGDRSDDSAPRSTSTARAPIRRGTAAGAPILLGLPYTANASAANAAAGSNAKAGGARDRWEVLLQDLNARGGIAGRRVVPRWFAYDAFGDYVAQEQAACTYFTQDSKVLAVLGRGINFGTEAFNACLEKAGVAFIQSGGTDWDDAVLRRYPHHVLSNGMSLDRLVRSAVAGLVEHKWATPNARIGLVTYDDPTYDRVVKRSLEPALARHGVRLTDIARVTKPQSYADLGGEGADASNAVLRFSTQGIDKVMFLELGGDIALLFMNAAEAQRYRPQYGLNSLDGGMLLASMVAEEQIEGAVGIGWVPTIDVTLDKDPAAKSPQRVRCFALMAKHGIATSDANLRASALSACDMLWLLERALSTRVPVSADGIIQGVNTVADTFTSALTFDVTFRGGRRDGADAYRLVAHDATCKCLQYVSGDRRAA